MVFRSPEIVVDRTVLVSAFGITCDEHLRLRKGAKAPIVSQVVRMETAVNTNIQAVSRLNQRCIERITDGRKLPRGVPFGSRFRRSTPGERRATIYRSEIRELDAVGITLSLIHI